MAGGKEHRTGLRHNLITRQSPRDIGGTVVQTSTTRGRIAARLTAIGEVGIAAGFGCNSVPVTSQTLIHGNPGCRRRSRRNLGGAVTTTCKPGFRLHRRSRMGSGHSMQHHRHDCTHLHIRSLAHTGTRRPADHQSQRQQHPQQQRKQGHAVDSTRCRNTAVDPDQAALWPSAGAVAGCYLRSVTEGEVRGRAHTDGSNLDSCAICTPTNFT